MNTTENNILIAEFMGFSLAEEIAPKLYINSKEKKQMYLRQMAYNSSWDWLIPVVEKIESLDNNVNTIFNSFDNNFSIIIEGYNIGGFPKTEKTTMTTQKEVLSKLQTTYNVIIEFIKWYNEQK